VSKLVTIYGSPGSGKTILAMALASRLALKKENVILVSSDKVVPHLKVLLPTVETDKSFSMGPLLLKSGLTQKQLIPKLVFHPDSGNLACLALAPGDTPISYPPLWEPANVMELLNVLSGLADVVLVDGMSNPAADSVTLTAMGVSERVICTLTPDRKGLEYLNAVLQLLRDEKYKTGKHLRILSPVRETSPVNELLGIIEDVQFLLPYSAEAEERMLSGKLFKGFTRRPGLVFERRVEEILEELK